MVDGELLEGLAKVGGSILRFLFRAILELLLEGFAELTGWIIKQLVRGVIFLLRALMGGGDLLHRKLFATALRLTQRRGLAHGMIMIVSIMAGFSAAAGASAAYHHIHPQNSKAADQR